MAKAPAFVFVKYPWGSRILLQTWGRKSSICASALPVPGSLELVQDAPKLPHNVPPLDGGHVLQKLLHSVVGEMLHIMQKLQKGALLIAPAPVVMGSDVLVIHPPLIGERLPVVVRTHIQLLAQPLQDGLAQTKQTRVAAGMQTPRALRIVWKKKKE